MGTWDASPQHTARATEFAAYDPLGFHRMVNWVCTSNCSGKTIEGLFVHEYEPDDRLGMLAVGGVPDLMGSCALSHPSGCDFAMQIPFVWPMAAPGHPPFDLMLQSNPYLNKAPTAVRDAVVILDADGNVTVVDNHTAAQKLVVEPLSGPGPQSHSPHNSSREYCASFQPKRCLSPIMCCCRLRHAI